MTLKLQSANYKLLAALSILSLLSFVLCPLSRASGSWLVDGQVVQTLEVTVDDPAALHTDGSRKMSAPLEFDSSASVADSGIFNAYIPWAAVYSDIFVLDEDEEVLWLASDENVSFGVGSLIVSSSRLLHLSYGCSVNFEEHSLNGGWFVPTVESDPYSIINRTYADSRYVLQSAGITTNYTIQAGDELQIQNGVITAINP